jgi:hypothetical protein
MVFISMALAMASVAQDQSAPDPRAVFALLERYRTSFRDVSFLHEGTLVVAKDGELGQTNSNRFQAYYAYRGDGATLLDVFSYGREDRPMTRFLYSILNGRSEFLNASPDIEPRVADRSPAIGRGGPGSLDNPTSPERIFLAPFFSTLGDAPEYKPESQGWEEIDGRRCLKIKMLAYPESQVKGWPGGLPYITLWFDLERDCYPLRLERFRGDNLEGRTEISRLERIELPAGRRLWFPAEGRTTSYSGNMGKDKSSLYSKEPQAVETHTILLETVKFDQGLSDGVFSVKKHAAVANDEGLRKLQHQLESRPKSPTVTPPSDPESRRKRLDKAFEEAEQQAAQLEASSAARAGMDWTQFLSGGMGVVGVITLMGMGFWYWRRR